MNQYVAFGLSGSPASGVRMQGGDVTVAWIDAASGVANAVDYYLQDYTQVYRSFAQFLEAKCSTPSLHSNSTLICTCSIYV